MSVEYKRPYVLYFPETWIFNSREMFDAESFCLYTPPSADEGKCMIVEAIEKNEENRYF